MQRTHRNLHQKCIKNPHQNPQKHMLSSLLKLKIAGPREASLTLLGTPCRQMPADSPNTHQNALKITTFNGNPPKYIQNPQNPIKIRAAREGPTGAALSVLEVARTIAGMQVGGWPLEMVAVCNISRNYIKISNVISGGRC